MQHVETISSFEGTIEIVQSFVVSITVFSWEVGFSFCNLLYDSSHCVTIFKNVVDGCS